ncbi:SMI1/KNR4 family protein [uncultured Maribacter sp.]|uniref:SMI1/KNR4 family protein n=1 Tax=uncultured Maribacter sp. TaxID=431308 RepID=UPI0026137F3B|nr:SMI1/KNR4 family protein [uncultured Maribacter sp.]
MTRPEMKYLLFIFLLLSTNCSHKMNIQSIPYNNQLKKVALLDIIFSTISLEEIPEPYFKDYSHHKSATVRNYKSYDTVGFRDILLKHLSKNFECTVLKLIIITPKGEKLHYDAFAYLSDKRIIGMHLEDKKSFKLWMDIIFKDQYQKLEEYKNNGQFERQPDLNPNPQFMLTLGKGQFSRKWVNSGMLIDEKPYENVGAYLYKNAPKQYNEAKIAKEKQNYIKKYIDTTHRSNVDKVLLKKLFDEFIRVKKIKPELSKNNEQVYKEFETSAGYAFPEELKLLLSLHNGIENTGFLTAEQILDEWNNWKEIYDSVDWMLIDLTGNSHPDGRKTIGIYTNPYWIPFLSTGSGNFIAIDYAPGNKGTSGQIIAFGADETKIRFIANNLEGFFRKLIDGKDVLNNGFLE